MIILRSCSILYLFQDGVTELWHFFRVFLNFGKLSSASICTITLTVKISSIWFSMLRCQILCKTLALHASLQSLRASLRYLWYQALRDWYFKCWWAHVIIWGHSFIACSINNFRPCWQSSTHNPKDEAASNWLSLCAASAVRISQDIVQEVEALQTLDLDLQENDYQGKLRGQHAFLDLACPNNVARRLHTELVNDTNIALLARTVQARSPH